MSTFGQFYVKSGFVCLALILFYNKTRAFGCETLIEIDSAMAKQTKKCDFVSFKIFSQQQFFITVKGIFEKHILNLVLE